MKKMKITVAGLSLLMMVGCGTSEKTGTAVGAGAGATLGAIVGGLLNNSHRGTGAAVGAAIGAAVGGVAGNRIGNHMDKVAAQTRQQVESAKVEQVTDANGLAAVKVTFDSGILFQTNKYDLNANAKNDLAKFSTVLKNNADCQVDIQGYTDNTGNDGINIPLSENRARSVYNYLTSCGVRSSQFKNIQGFGASNPVADNTTVAGRQANRRVEVYLYASQAMVDAANNGTLR